MKKLVITHSEESTDFTLVHEDGREEHIKNFNHDDHGWRAMEDAGNALEKLATALGATIEHADDNGEEDPE